MDVKGNPLSGIVYCEKMFFRKEFGKLRPIHKEPILPGRTYCGECEKKMVYFAGLDPKSG